MTGSRTQVTACRGVRGATVVEEDTPQLIHDAIRELVAEIVRLNDIDTDDLAAAFFTTTPDLHSAFPAEAARHMGWHTVPMLGATEMDQESGMERCIRVMLLWNTTRRQDEIHHVYLRGTEALRTVSNPHVAERNG